MSQSPATQQSRSTGHHFRIIEGAPFMGRKNRKSRRPFDPAEALRQEYERRHNPDRWGVNQDAMTLATNDDVTQTEATRERVARVVRYDCFSLLRTRGALSEESEAAVRRFQADLAARMRSEGSDRSTPGVATAGSREGVTIRSLEAAARLTAVAGEMDLMATQLILALSEPAVIRGERVNWRATVQKLTGEDRDIPQRDRVVRACDAVLAAYQAVDSQPRRAA